MEVALQLVGAGPGDEVVTPAQSFFASANVIERVGARAVFVDVDLATRNIDLDAAEAALIEKTRAAARAADDYVHESPWQAVGIGVGVGFLLGLLLNRR